MAGRSLWSVLMLSWLSATNATVPRHDPGHDPGLAAAATEQETGQDQEGGALSSPDAIASEDAEAGAQSTDQASAQAAGPGAAEEPD